MDPPGIEPGASSVRGMRSTDELRARTHGAEVEIFKTYGKQKITRLYTV